MHEPAAPAGPHHITAASSPADGRTHVLKHSDTFAVFDHHGDIRRDGLGEEGLYHHGTRHLSSLLLELNDVRPFLLDSSLTTDGDALSVVLTNPDLMADGRVQTPLGALHLTTTTFLWEAALYREIEITNYALAAIDVSVVLQVHADYADIFEVRGLARTRRGDDLAAVVTGDGVTLGYRGLDDVVRRTVLRFTPAPTTVTASEVRYALSLAPRQTVRLEITIGCARDGTTMRTACQRNARDAARASLHQRKSSEVLVHTSNPQVDAWVGRATADVRLLTTDLQTGLYPFAGIPWFNTPFGRDGIITALECLWCQPALARGVLAYLASMQASEVLPHQDAEPGKIVHETRTGEMAALGEMPFGRYYGSVDSTPLFVVLAGAYYERTGDLAFIQSLWLAIEAALAWIDEYGDQDQDGFVEYQRRSADGLIHQGWKDSDDAVTHEDGAAPTGAIAMCEVQGYVYAARRAGASLAEALDHHERARVLVAQAEALRARFEAAFWCECLGTYALALDGRKHPCRVRASNAGHALFARIASPQRAARVAGALFEDDLFSGWGLRTLGSREVRYNPMGYHTGAIWPHDNALIACGLASYGLRSQAVRLLEAMFDASHTFQGQRMPELFCGFPRESALAPVPYPLACAPQAWASGAVLLLLQSCLGLQVDGRHARVVLTDPHLPACFNELSIHRLGVGEGSVDFSVFRHGQTVGIHVLRRDGAAEVVLQ